MNLTDATFDNETKTGISVIDFWAPWCVPCKNILPIIDELAKTYDNSDIKILKVNVDECSEAPAKFGIKSIPTILVLKDGAEINRNVGSEKVKEKIEEMILKARNS